MLLQSAAESGNPAAEFGMYVYYRGKPNHEPVADEWLEKAAGQGNGNALCEMAIRCEGDGDAEQSKEYFRQAAETGHDEALFRYALLLEDWSDRQAPSNQEAFSRMKAAADAGHSRALCYLGNYHSSGMGVEVDHQQAFECYMKSAEKNDAIGIMRLGEYYGYNADPVKAFQCFQRAAELREVKGLCHLGLCYISGLGCQQNIEMGFRVLFMAAGSGEPAVMIMLQNAGLDVEKVSSGYRESRKLEARMQPGHFNGAVFDRIFSKQFGSIPSIPPKSE